MKRYLFLLLWATSLGGLVLFSEDVENKVDDTQEFYQKVAIMAYHEPREPVLYNDMRRLLYDSYSLKLLRWFYRTTAIALDLNSDSFQILGSVCIFAFTFCVFLAYINKRYRLWLGSLAFCALNGFVGLIYIFSGVASLNQHDMKGPLHAQKLIDVLVMRGIPFDVYWDWAAFKKKWDESNGQAYHAIAWTGIPLGGDEIQIEEWLKDHRATKLLHVCLGAHLPAMFHRAVFHEAAYELEWDRHSGKSICDQKSVHERTVSWREIGKDPVAGVFAGAGYQVLYLPSTLTAFDVDRLWLQAQSQQPNWATLHLDLKGTVALRMDLPGSVSENVRSIPSLSVEKWQEIEVILKEHQAHLTVGYVAGWVDDGDLKRGELYLKQQQVTDRQAGSIYSASAVRYHHAKLGWHDLVAQAEFLKHSDSIETEIHGYTHITPDVQAWLEAPDRETEAGWYREFLVTEQRPFKQRERAVQAKILNQAMSEHLKTFERKTVLLIPPGNAISWDTDEICVENDLWGLCDQSLVIDRGGIVRRTRLIPSFELNSKRAEQWSQVALEFPAVATFTPDEIQREGVVGLAAQMKTLQATKWVSVRELMAMVKFIPELKVDLKKGRLLLNFPAVNLDPMPQHWQQTFVLRPPQGWRWKVTPEGWDAKTQLWHHRMSNTPKLLEFELEPML